jgi:hypothetical protein
VGVLAVDPNGDGDVPGDQMVSLRGGGIHRNNIE